jgi:hypothetical protein
MAQQMFSDEYSEYISECSNWIAALGIDGNIDFVSTSVSSVTAESLLTPDGLANRLAAREQSILPVNS